MTSKISLAKNHSVLNLFRFTLRKQTPLTLLVTAFTLLICPGMLLDYTSGNPNGETNQLSDSSFAAYSFIILAAAAWLVFMLLLLNFGFLFSKKAGDMYNALPLTRNQLLFTRGIGALVGGIFLMSASYTGLIMVNFSPTVDGVGVITVISTFLFLLLSLIVLTAFYTLFVICSGGIFDTIIALGAINIAPAIILALVIGNSADSAVGLTTDYSMLIYLTPIAVVFCKLINLPTILEKPESIIEPIGKTGALTIIGLIAFTVVCIVLAVKLFKVRRSESAGNAYAFKFMPITISLLVSIVGGYFMAGILNGFYWRFNISFWLLFAICAVLCAITVGAITNRGFKNIKHSIINGILAAALMTALMIGGMYVAQYAQNRIPKTVSVDKVYIGEIEFTKTPEIAINLHKGMLDCTKNENNSEDYMYPEVIRNITSFRFKYNMKNGAVMQRRYWYNGASMRVLHDDILALMQTDSFYKQYDECTKRSESSRYIKIQAYSGKFKTSYDGNDSVYAYLTEKEAKRLIEIFKKDMQAADVSIFDENAYEVSISGNEYRNLYVPVSFDETIEYLTDKFTSYMQKEEADKIY